MTIQEKQIPPPPAGIAPPTMKGSLCGNVHFFQFANFRHVSYREGTVTMHHFENVVLPERTSRLWLLYFFGEFCEGCGEVFELWDELHEVYVLSFVCVCVWMIVTLMSTEAGMIIIIFSLCTGHEITWDRHGQCAYLKKLWHSQLLQCGHEQCSCYCGCSEQASISVSWTT